MVERLNIGDNPFDSYIEQEVANQDVSLLKMKNQLLKPSKNEWEWNLKPDCEDCKGLKDYEFGQKFKSSIFGMIFTYEVDGIQKVLYNIENNMTLYYEMADSMIRAGQLKPI